MTNRPIKPAKPGRVRTSVAIRQVGVISTNYALSISKNRGVCHVSTDVSGGVLLGVSHYCRQRVSKCQGPGSGLDYHLHLFVLVKGTGSLIDFGPTKTVAKGGCRSYPIGAKCMSYVILIHNDQGIFYPHSQVDFIWNSQGCPALLQPPAE